METAFGEWVVKHPWWMIVATVVAVLAAANGVRLSKADKLSSARKEKADETVDRSLDVVPDAFDVPAAD
ncbi:MAG: hypothetical protein ACE5NG_16000 [bacterium]